MTIRTVDGEPPLVFSSPAEARAHFRQHHLESAFHAGLSFRLHGSVACRLPEPAVMQAIRDAHARELRYPAQFVQLLRQGLQNAGLHIFKHRKRIVFVAATRPTPFSTGSGTVTENVSLILETIAASPLCTRKTLAERVLGKRSKKPGGPVRGDDERPSPPAPEAAHLAAETNSERETNELSAPAEPDAPSNETSAETPPAVSPPGDDASRARAALAADVRFLVQAGHIIEFHNGTFDLPLPPRPKEDLPPKAATAALQGRDEGTDSIGSDPAMLSDDDATFVPPPEPRGELAEGGSSGAADSAATASHAPAALAAEYPGIGQGVEQSPPLPEVSNADAAISAAPLDRPRSAEEPA